MTHTKTDKFGFPIETCRRCGSSGRYSYNCIDGDRCYGCGGTGYRHPRGTVADEFAAFRTAVREAREPQVAQLNPGDVVSYLNTWRTVADVTDTGEWCGETRIGVPGTPTYRVTVRTYRLVRFHDGTEAKLPCNQLVRRSGRQVDPRPYVERARAAYATASA